jgi:hypothetical protein
LHVDIGLTFFNVSYSRFVGSVADKFDYRERFDFAQNQVPEASF